MGESKDLRDQSFQERGIKEQQTSQIYPAEVTVYGSHPSPD